MKHYKDIGWSFPDSDTHFANHMRARRLVANGRHTYQYRRLKQAISLCDQKRVAVDVGAHCGLMSWALSFEFQKVIAFEPVPEHRECFLRNLSGIDNVELHALALGEAVQEVTMANYSDGNSGMTKVSQNFGGPSMMGRLDAMEFPALDFMKLDCEGYEYFALRGGIETIKRHRPVIMVEQPGPNWEAAEYGISGMAAVELLRKLGMKLVTTIGNDFILNWEERNDEAE